jgi:hypothetical protein
MRPIDVRPLPWPNLSQEWTMKIIHLRIFWVGETLGATVPDAKALIPYNQRYN